MNSYTHCVLGICLVAMCIAVHQDLLVGFNKLKEWVGGIEERKVLLTVSSSR